MSSNKDTRPADIDLEARIRQAESLLKQRQFAEVERLSLDLIGASPDRPAPRLLFARAAMGRRDWQAAVGRWQEVKRRFPGNARGAIGLATAFLECGRLDEAEREFARIADRWPGKPQGVIGMARVADQRRDSSRASRHWQQAVERYPNNREAALGFANALLDERRFAEARSLFEQIRDRWGAAAAASKGMARVAMRQRRWIEAAEHWKEVLATRPKDRGGLSGCITSLINSGQFDQADAINRSFLELGPADPHAHFFRAKILHAKSQLDDAMTLWHDLSVRFPAHIEPHLGIARIHFDRREFEMAATIVSDALKRWPDNIPALHMLANVERATENWMHARQVNEHILRLDPNNLRAKVDLGRALSELGFLTDAKRILSDAIREDETLHGAYWALSNVIERERRQESQSG